MINGRFTYAALYAVAAVATPAAAGEQARIVVTGDVPTALVSYADIDLRSPQGVAALQERVRRAARMLCRRGGVASLDIYMARTACRKDAIASAADQIAVAARGSGDRLASARTITVAAGH